MQEGTEGWSLCICQVRPELGASPRQQAALPGNTAGKQADGRWPTCGRRPAAAGRAAQYSPGWTPAQQSLCGEGTRSGSSSRVHPRKLGPAGGDSSTQPPGNVVRQDRMGQRSGTRMGRQQAVSRNERAEGGRHVRQLPLRPATLPNNK